MSEEIKEGAFSRFARWLAVNWRGLILLAGLIAGAFASLVIAGSRNRVTPAMAKRLAEAEREADELEIEHGYETARQVIEEDHLEAVRSLKAKMHEEYEELRRSDLKDLARMLVSHEEGLF